MNKSFLSELASMKWVAVAASAAAVATLSGCLAHRSLLQPVCGSDPNAQQCTGQMDVPTARAGMFEDAGRIAIDRIFSPQFEQAVATFVAERAQEEGVRHHWEGLTSNGAVDSVRRALPSARLGTYDGVGAWIDKRLWGNLAWEANEAVPARVNRWGLGGRSAASLANSIVHEAAHAGGLTHYGENRECGPPYVLGLIVERLETGGDLSPDALCPEG